MMSSLSFQAGKVMSDTSVYSIHYLDSFDVYNFELALSNIWEKLIEDGIVKSLFYGGTVKSFPDFFDFMNRRGTLAYVLLKNKDLHGFFWLNNFVGKTAQIHCTGFKKSIGTRRNAHIFARKCISYALCLNDDDGFLIDTVLGYTPISNTLSVKFNERAGMIKIGQIPSYCNMAYEGTVVDAVLTYATRETLNLSGELESIWIE